MSHIPSTSPGLDIILGPMCSGKSTEALRRLKCVASTGLKVVYINSTVDTRSEGVFSTHNDQLSGDIARENLITFKVRSLSCIKLEDVKDAKMIVVDEGQFFDDLEIVRDWINPNEMWQKRVVIASLDGSFECKPIGKVLSLIPDCDSVIKLNAICVNCAALGAIEPAPFTHRKGAEKSEFLVGGKDKYTSLCRKCFLKG